MSNPRPFDPITLRTQAAPFTKPRRAFVAEYEYDPSIVLAINVALVTGRPLLLRGDPGAGKSTLAEDVAWLLGRRYYEQVVSSNSEIADLLWRVDHVARIADAQAHAPREPSRYLRPGVLFWAFNPSAAKQLDAHDPELRSWDIEDAHATPAVVLIDEIDKAEPDFPNDLLGPLGNLSFRVHTTGIDMQVAAASPPLIVLTTNEERDLPPAFLRRCIVLRLALPDRARLTDIARRHFTPAQLDEATLQRVLDRYFELRESATQRKLRAPGTAEFLDAARAVIALGSHVPVEILEQSWEFREITQSALWKHRQLPELDGVR